MKWAREGRAIAATALALVLGSACSGLAQQAARPSLPDGLDESAIGARMVLPPPPPGLFPPGLTLGDHLPLPDGLDERAIRARTAFPPGPPPIGTETTGSIPALGAQSASLPLGEGLPRSFPDAENPAGADGVAPSGPPVAAPAASVAPPPAAAAPAAAAAAPAATEAAPPAAAAPPPATAAAPAGLDAASLASALPSFVADRPAGDTAAQAAERRTQREAIAAVYAAHGTTPLWIEGDHLTAGARDVLARLDHAADDGLDVARFAVPVPRDGATATLARAELALSEAVVAYARQASGARVDVPRIGALIDFRPVVATAAQVLESLPAAAHPADMLQAFNPPQPGYAALRDKLAELRRTTVAPLARIPYGPVLKPGMTDARVPLIRARFGLDVAADEPGAPADIYDTQVAEAVAAFQRSRHMAGSGLLTARTVAALSGGNPVSLENTIIANMELWRWMPREQAADRIEVNIPDYKVRVLREGAVAHETRVVVGQPDKPTPVFAEQMRFIIVNPYWNVPLSIIKNEMLPKLASDPDYFANHGYEVVERNGTTYVRQPPGETNALGRIKFMFPNSHAVYLHDTNARSYFDRSMRALSHGCVRVEQPFSFAEAVMGRDNGWSEARIKRLIGGTERTINLPRPMPILITYFTAFVDTQDGFQVRDDVYGYAGRIKAALGLQG